MSRKFVTWIAALTTAFATVLPAIAQEREPVDPVEDTPVEEPTEQREKVSRSIEPANLTPIDAVDKETDQVARLGTGTERRTYLIRLVDDAVPTYDGGVPGLQPTAPDPGETLDPDSAPVREYQEFLVEEQVSLIQRLDRIAGRDVEVPFTYQFAVNGFAAVLTPEEAREIALDPAVASISLDEERELHTDRGPQLIGAPTLWNAQAELGLPEDIKGEGVVIGTIDTGISPGNQSFADVGGDGYDHDNPYGSFLGVCDPANPDSAGGFDPGFPCNDKLVGAYVFGALNDTAVDYDGHGSHTSSTSGGNVVNDVVVETPTFTTPPFDISGVAPHANVISYLGCCSVSGLTAAIDQAIADGVDAINYSIGSSAPSQLWDDFDTVGFLNARAAGIFVATSNGNAGPFEATTGSPSDAPWITSVGASQHDRNNGNILTDLNSSAGPLPDIVGKSTTGSLGATPIVYAGDFGDPLCGDTTGHEAEFAGNIVVCDRGVFGRVQKSQNVAGQGAAGFVLIQAEADGPSLLGDTYVIPGVFITFADGQVLLDWLATGTGHEAAIAGTEFEIGDQFADIIGSFSSRGPNRAVDILVPDVTAPGVDILAALHDLGATNQYDVDVHGFISGTSMASPHVAGAGALLTQAHPDWTPAEMQSALMTTASPTVANQDLEPATPYTQGAGRIDVGLAAQASLIFDETFANYMAANPDEGGDPKTLNLPSFANTQCLAVCAWDRTATVPDGVPAGVTWTASTVADDGLSIDVSLSDATVSPGDSTDITVTATVAGAPEGETLFGRITLTPDNPDVPTVTMPLAVVPADAVLPGEVEITTRRNAGSHVVSDIQSIEVTDFTGSMLGMVPGTLNEGSLDQDPTRDDPYDDLSQVDVYLVDVPAGATRLISESIEAEMPDLDLFVGQGDTPSLATQVCASTSPTAVEKCDITDPDPGTWWVLIQNWGGSEEQPDAYVTSTAVVPSEDLGNAGIEGPETVPVGEPYDVTVHWDIPEMTAGDRWYGTAVFGSSASTPGDIGAFPVTIIRADDDVAKTASPEQAKAGDTVSYEITIQPNLTPENLNYTITDTIPDGLTVDPASVTGGGVVDGQTITWEVEVPSPVGQTGSYAVSTPATSEQCLAWSGFVDLGAAGIGLAPLDGDSVAATAFGNIGPFEHYGELFPNLVVTEDGFVTVTGGYGGFPWIPQVMPNTSLPNGVLAPLWSDLELSLADSRGMRLATSAGVGAAIVQWDDPFEWTSDATVGPSVGKFQAWIYNTVEDFRPEMTFEYGTLGELPGTSTIGTENILGTLATAALNAGDPSGILEEGGTICLDYEGPSFGEITLAYDVTVDEDAEPGIYTNEVVHVTDDPFAQPATTSTDVEVLEQEADVSIVKTGEQTGIREIVYTVTVSNDGPDDATGVVVTDELPAEVEYLSDTCEAANLPPWTWEIGDLAAGAVVECMITVGVADSATIDNTATVTGEEADPNPDNNESTATVEAEVCTVEVTGVHTGRLRVSEGVTCLDGATVIGPVTVDEGAALLSSGSQITGPLRSNGALLLSLCDTGVTGPVRVDRSSAVELGDPTVDCAGNQIVGPVTVNRTDGPSVIADNTITGALSCANNEPPPVNNGFPNSVTGPQRGQCADL